MSEAGQNTHLFGELAVELGLISPEQLNAALEKQTTLRASSAKSRLGETLIIMNLLTVEQVKKVLSEQRKRRQADADKILPMEHFGEYRLLSKLGEGGMGVVYKAHDPLADRFIALKVLRKNFGANREFLDRFDREARLAGSLSHRHIVTCYTAGVKNGVQYMALEFVEGTTLKSEITRWGGRVPEHEALRVAHDIAVGLAHAHEKGVVHRDIKPDNILVAHDGTVKISDFGTAKSVLDNESLTQTGMIIGTPYYISPEQVRALKDVDHRADLYALGGTLYHMLTGHVPFYAPTVLEIMRAHLNAELENPADLNPQLSGDAVQIVTKLMAKEPTERYQAAQELVEDLDRVMNGQAPLHATLAENRSSVKAPMRLRKRARKQESSCLLVALAALVPLALWFFLPPAGASARSTPQLTKISTPQN
jgi:eukaryotic-like serine/threonine-protein kinase